MGERRPSVLGCLLGPEMEWDSVMEAWGQRYTEELGAGSQKTKGSPFVRAVSGIHTPQRTLRLSEMTQQRVKLSGILPQTPLLFSKVINLQYTHGRKGLWILSELMKTLRHCLPFRHHLLKRHTFP